MHMGPWLRIPCSQPVGDYFDVPDLGNRHINNDVGKGGHYGQPKRQLFGTRAQTPPQSAVQERLTVAGAHTALKPPSGPREARQAAVGVAGTTKRGSLQNAPWLQQKSGGLRFCLRQPQRCISRSNYVCKAAKFGVLQNR